MSGNSRRLLAAAIVPAAVALVLAGSGAAGASTGSRYASAEQVGYAATGAQFKDVHGVVYLGAITAAGTWHRAIEVPGTGALNKGGFGDVQSVSCGSAGNCAAVGDYVGGSGHFQVFVASERDGTWRGAIEIPGTGALNKDGDAGVTSVSCASAGNCLAGGDYTDGAGHRQAFVASERDGTWHRAIEVPGTGALNKGGVAGVTSVSCASAGNCLAGGTYAASPGPADHTQVFVASERDGTWRTAIEVPGSGALNAGGFASVTSVSCASAGNCAAGGSYLNSAGGRTEAFVASERNGSWRTAIEVPGSSALNKGFGAEVTSVSCASAGNCAAGGTYNGPGYVEAFVASERNGTWRTAIEVPGSGALNKDGGGGVASVSCASAGNCLAGGYYRDSSDDKQAFVASERNGTWRRAIEIPGTGALNITGFAEVYSVSCASAGNCLVGGDYDDSSFHLQAFVASERNGTWRTAIEVPGTGALNKDGVGAVYSVSCASAGHCAAGGGYEDGSGHGQAFVASQT